MLFKIILVVVSLIYVSGFNVINKSNVVSRQNIRISMEYIPDGLSKEQWRAMKQKEKESSKNKDLGKVGITKFKSRSFEAWQKSGQKHLFPVNPDTPLDERPYMQRKGGSADGEDLKKRGLMGKGQAFFSKKVDADVKYEKLEKEGKLKSTPFSVPWTASAAEKLARENAKAAKEINAAKKNAKSNKKVEPEVKEKKKGLFGIF